MNEANIVKLHGMSDAAYKKIEPKLRLVSSYRNIIGGKFYWGISYLILFGIPLWFNKKDNYLFVVDDGVILVSKELWSGFSVPLFFDYSQIKSIAGQKNTFSRKMNVFLENDMIEYDCNSGSFLQFLADNAAAINIIAPKLGLGGTIS